MLRFPVGFLSVNIYFINLMPRSFYIEKKTVWGWFNVASPDRITLGCVITLGFHRSQITVYDIYLAIELFFAKVA